ncbi:MAG: hypothetical protein M1497_06275 [Nitrospirae bacterium]|nr:hypothetical protein [Nitrospirota bacterium]
MTTRDAFSIFRSLNNSGYVKEDWIKQACALIAPNLLENEKINFFHVNGTMSSGQRNNLINDFKEAEIGVMSNARCLIEGVDVPAVNAVAFIDSKKSITDIVQATGRAIRKSDGKQPGYIFVPVVTSDTSSADDALKSSDFDSIWQVLQSMQDQDQKLEMLISRLKVLKGQYREQSAEWATAVSELTERIEVILPVRVDRSRFVARLHARTVEVVGRTWDFWYGQTLLYKKRITDIQMPHIDIRPPRGIALGCGSLSRGAVTRSDLSAVTDIRNSNPWVLSFQRGLSMTNTLMSFPKGSGSVLSTKKCTAM